MADKTSANTYLENRIQNKYPINHEESIRTGLQMQPMHTCVREDADGKQEGDIRRISTNEQAELASARIRSSGKHEFMIYQQDIRGDYPKKLSFESG